MDKVDNLIEVRDLSFSRGSRLIFDRINLDVLRGQVVAIMGPSGSGKTTLLKLISRQLVPDRGVVRVDGENWATLPDRKLYPLRRKMGMLFQSGALFTGMNVYENVAFPLREQYNLPEAMIRDVVLMQLEAVGLRGAINLMPSELSGGMARRVALARALVTNPMVMLYDEPFTGQDPITLGILLKLIRDLNRELALTTVIVSHDVYETLSISDYAYIVYNGRVVGEGTPAQIKRNENALITQFINGQAEGPITFSYPAPNYLEDLALCQSKI